MVFAKAMVAKGGGYGGILLYIHVYVENRISQLASVELTQAHPNNDSIVGH